MSLRSAKLLFYRHSKTFNHSGPVKHLELLPMFSCAKGPNLTDNTGRPRQSIFSYANEKWSSWPGLKGPLKPSPANLSKLRTGYVDAVAILLSSGCHQAAVVIGRCEM